MGRITNSIMNLDLRTIFFIYTFTNAAGIIVIASLWHTNRKKYNGLAFVLADFILQLFALILVMLRGQIPDFLSIVLSNLFSLGGTILILFALEKFFEQKPTIKLNTALIIIFLSSQIWFTYFIPNLPIRNLNISMTFSFICLQILFLIYFRLSSGYRKYTKGISIVFFLYLGVNIIRIFDFFINDQQNLDYFKSGSFEKFIILSYSFLFVLLTFSLVMLINRRLLSEIAFQEEKYFKVFHESPNVIMLTRLVDAKILEVNQSFEVLTGFLASEAIGRSSFSLNLWENEESRYQIISALKEKGTLRKVESTFRIRNGNLVDCSISADIILIDGEEFILITVEDISAFKKLLNELMNSAEELKHLNATKDKLFSIIAHDLRGPFANIINLSELLKDQIQSKEYEGIDEYANLIQTSTQKVTGLLSNLLEWSQLKTGKMNFCRTPTNLHDLLIEVVDLLKFQAHQKEIDILFEVEKNIVANIDKNMFSTILRNLISNSIKFTNKHGQIQIHLTYKDGMVNCSIQDNGVGMDKLKLEKLFKIEEKVTTLGTNNEQGSGLGLFLCKEFIELHNGKIVTSSEIGKGTLIRFNLQG